MPPTARARRAAAFALTGLLTAPATAALADGDPANGAEIFYMRNKKPFNLAVPRRRQDVVAYLKGQCTGGH